MRSPTTYRVIFTAFRLSFFPRCVALGRVNSLLREQLEQTGSINQGLTESLWKARGDSELCDARLRKEQEVRERTIKRQDPRVGGHLKSPLVPPLLGGCAIKTPSRVHMG